MIKFLQNYTSYGIKYRHVEITGLYMILIFLIALLSHFGVISNSHLENYEIALALTVLFLVSSTLLSYRQNYKYIVMMCNVSFVIVCIGLYYSVSPFSFLLVLLSLYTIVRVLGIVYMEQMKKYEEDGQGKDHLTGNFFRNYHAKKPNVWDR